MTEEIEEGMLEADIAKEARNFAIDRTTERGGDAMRVIATTLVVYQIDAIARLREIGMDDDDIREGLDDLTKQAFDNINAVQEQQREHKQ